MKKCLRCKIAYHAQERFYCLYCQSMLADVEESDEPEFVDAFSFSESLLEKLVHGREVPTVGNRLYVLSSYFRIRTFHFMYMFCRNELKMGKVFKRFFVQPLNLVFLINIPWFVVNLVDSLFFKLFYNSYCPQCNWKYIRFTGTQERHDADQCAYNQEYGALLNDICTARFVKTEDEFKRRSGEKIRQGQRSAYVDLCCYKDQYQAAVDTASVWFSSGIILYLIVVALFPLAVNLVNGLEL